MVNEEIKEYIVAARARNTSDSAIKDQLIKAGWDLGDVMKTFDAIGTDGIPVPSPHISGHFGMWVSFLYILLFISLYILATSVGAILHTAVDKIIPDTIEKADLYSYYSSYTDSDWYINAAKAAIIVSYPVFAVLLYLLGKQSVLRPYVRKLRARKILIYLSLVATFVIMIGALIGTLYAYLNDGMISSRIVAHLFVTIAISGGIFGVLFYMVRGDKRV